MTLLQQFKCKNKAKLICGGGPRSIKLPFCLPSSIKSSNPLHEWRGFAAHTSEEKQPKIPEWGKKNIALFISPLPLSLFPTLPKVLLGNRSQVFDKPVVDMTAVQSSV